ncbi:energy-coupling factor ABC transporter ATP-binding protein [Priestia endophytica]|uniref:energy-coupling factor ABC transporter ATP-binding protein n=1 Tax=Priestia endophytica TaxID=135735 RepID=UPI002E1F04CE|nr:energy-coupling factor ABC transporter ATP-binding protein [Priestia endophytica]MED4073292.1 energy-coupling factor ABC transporter ATP-binding protein [Priestia endophytica]
MEIIFKNVEHRYQLKTPFERLALEDVSLSIPSGQFVSLIGHTGSGKSTVIQHLNALLKPTKGSIQIGARTIESGKKEKHLKEVRKRVGVVFQFPEHQLFDETVEKDICFGPMNFGVSEEEAKKRANELATIVGLPKEVLQKSPFDLSGGQMRRVAIAGILAMEPQVLVLDEPTAGLDPRGRNEIMNLISSLNKEQGLTIVLVTHSMEDAAQYADRIIVMDKGKVSMSGTPKEIFKQHEKLKEIGLDIPEPLRFILDLEQRLGVSLSHEAITFKKAVEEVTKLFGGRAHDE